MKWDSINTCSAIGLAGWLPAEAALKRLGAAIMQVELQRRWGWGRDDSALITGSEQGVIRFGRERRGGEMGVWREGGLAARKALMTCLVYCSEKLPFSKAQQLQGDLWWDSVVLGLLQWLSKAVTYWPINAGQGRLVKYWCSLFLLRTHDVMIVYTKTCDTPVHPSNLFLCKHVC